MVDADHPLFVYLPCGVGGGPGGVAFGLKLAFGDNALLLRRTNPFTVHAAGDLYRLHDTISVQDIGIDNLTAADGLAVGRASGFVGRAMERLLDGLYTPDDQTMYDMLGWLAQEEGIRLEPSALAGWPVRNTFAPLLTISTCTASARISSITPPTWCGRPAVEWSRKMKWRSIWPKDVKYR